MADRSEAALKPQYMLPSLHRSGTTAVRSRQIRCSNVGSDAQPRCCGSDSATNW
jgi:hypothetical protein